jgi:hypothetical protein
MMMAKYQIANQAVSLKLINLINNIMLALLHPRKSLLKAK